MKKLDTMGFEFEGFRVTDAYLTSEGCAMVEGNLSTNNGEHFCIRMRRESANKPFGLVGVSVDSGVPVWSLKDGFNGIAEVVGVYDTVVIALVDGVSGKVVDVVPFEEFAGKDFSASQTHYLKREVARKLKTTYTLTSKEAVVSPRSQSPQEVGQSQSPQVSEMEVEGVRYIVRRYTRAAEAVELSRYNN